MEVRNAEAIVKALNDANIHYFMVGGLPVIAHGCVTCNVSIIIGLESGCSNE